MTDTQFNLLMKELKEIKQMRIFAMKPPLPEVKDRRCVPPNCNFQMRPGWISKKDKE